MKCAWITNHHTMNCVQRSAIQCHPTFLYNIQSLLIKLNFAIVSTYDHIFSQLTIADNLCPSSCTFNKLLYVLYLQNLLSIYTMWVDLNIPLIVYQVIMSHLAMSLGYCIDFCLQIYYATTQTMNHNHILNFILYGFLETQFALHIISLTGIGWGTLTGLFPIAIGFGNCMFFLYYYIYYDNIF